MPWQSNQSLVNSPKITILQLRSRCFPFRSTWDSVVLIVLSGTLATMLLTYQMTVYCYNTDLFQVGFPSNSRDYAQSLRLLWIHISSWDCLSCLGIRRLLSDRTGRTLWMEYFPIGTCACQSDCPSFWGCLRSRWFWFGFCFDWWVKRLLMSNSCGKCRSLWGIYFWFCMDIEFGSLSSRSWKLFLLGKET